MKIAKLALALTETDLNTMLSTAMERMAKEQPQAKEMASKVKDPRISLKDGLIVFRCKAALGFIPVPVEAQLRLAPANGGEALDITLEKVSMAMMGGSTVASQLMSQVAGMVAGKPGIAVSGNTLTVALATLAQSRQLELAGKLNFITASNGTISFDLS